MLQKDFSTLLESQLHSFPGRNFSSIHLGTSYVLNNLHSAQIPNQIDRTNDPKNLWYFRKFPMCSLKMEAKVKWKVYILHVKGSGLSGVHEAVSQVHSFTKLIICFCPFNLIFKIFWTTLNWNPFNLLLHLNTCCRIINP